MSKQVLSLRRDSPDTDKVISVSSIKGRSVSGPGERETSRVGNKSGSGEVREVLAQVGDNLLALQIPDDDSGVGGGA